MFLFVLVSVMSHSRVLPAKYISFIQNILCAKKASFINFDLHRFSASKSPLVANLKYLALPGDVGELEELGLRVIAVAVPDGLGSIYI